MADQQENTTGLEHLGITSEDIALEATEGTGFSLSQDDINPDLLSKSKEENAPGAEAGGDNNPDAEAAAAAKAAEEAAAAQNDNGGANPPLTENTPAPTALYKELFGEEVDNEDKVREKVALMQATIDELTSKMAEAGPQVDDDIKLMMAFRKETGISDTGLFNELSSLKEDADHDAIELLVLQKQLEGKRAFTSEQKALYRAMYREQYKQDEEKYTDQEQQIGKLMLDEEKQKALNSIKAVQENIKKGIQPADTPAGNQQEVMQARWDSWKPKVVEIGNDPTSSKLSHVIKFEAGQLPLADGKEIEVSVDFDIPAEKKTQYLRDAMHQLVRNGSEITEENIKSVRSYVRTRGIQDYHEEIVQKAVKTALEKAAEKADLFIHNPSGVNKDTSRENSGGEEIDDADFVFKNYVEPRI